MDEYADVTDWTCAAQNGQRADEERKRAVLHRFGELVAHLERRLETSLRSVRCVVFHGAMDESDTALLPHTKDFRGFYDAATGAVVDRKTPNARMLYGDPEGAGGACSARARTVVAPVTHGELCTRYFAYSYMRDDAQTVCVGGRVLCSQPGRVDAILAHELGHIIEFLSLHNRLNGAPPEVRAQIKGIIDRVRAGAPDANVGNERVADELAEAFFNLRVCYPTTDHVQLGFPADTPCPRGTYAGFRPTRG